MFVELLKKFMKAKPERTTRRFLSKRARKSWAVLKQVLPSIARVGRRETLSDCLLASIDAGPGDVWQAVKDKDVGRVKQLMENEFVPDEYDMAHGGTPLHQATWDGETVRGVLRTTLPVALRLNRRVYIPL